ncbi:MAG: glycoside hydrolase [Campylobacterales bacterium]|nr:glycoside hydrolase [Campylobacterales bacterium]
MNTNTLNLCFFWHMHQPDYRNPQGVMNMPWVFLHAIKDYYEMPWLLAKFPNLKASFNITAPLIEQLNLYKEPLKYDYFLSLWFKEASELEPDERSWLIKTCKSTQFETMVLPMPRFKTLYEQESLTDDELVEFEMLFMLCWCGNYLREENEVVKKLFAQESGYVQGQKKELLDALTAFVETILPFYAKLQKEGVISLSTTPYNHPILPLLLDMQNAKRANPHTTIVDNTLSLREDAIEQVKCSIELYEKSFGIKPTGFWPAEGAVDEASVEIYKEFGIKWIATDEAILFRSLGDDNREKLYMPYDFNGMSMGFRDHGISDLIGFTYRFKSGEGASEHFMQTLEPIAKTKDNSTLFVILDGENAWEFFNNNAYDFFMTLYKRLDESTWCKTITMDSMSKLTAKGVLSRLSPGSWIHGNFDTWSGHSEKNRAWELIYQTKRDFEHHKGQLSTEVLKKIKFHFLASECSDWFWWYGDDHSTEFSLEFDTLFREHLISIYNLMEISAPAELFVPIVSHKQDAAFILKPQSTIYPLIDGKDSSFFEWLGCGSIDESRIYSTMDRVRGPIEKILYGQDEEKIYIALEGDMHKLKTKTMALEVTIEESGERILFKLQHNQENSLATLAIDERVELSLSKSCCQEFGEVRLRFELLEGTQIIQTMPGYGALAINLNESYAANWFV